LGRIISVKNTQFPQHRALEDTLLFCYIMKILITGSNGLLGFYLVRDLTRSGHEVLGTGLGIDRIPPVHLPGTGQYWYQPLDITDGAAVMELVGRWRPDWILHNAAWAQPDLCETNPVGCWAVNVTATRFLAEAARAVGASFLLVSTDFVFDGINGPYREEDATSPVNYYGCSKLVAEKAVAASGVHWAIVRTVLVYGQSPTVKRFNLLTWVRDKLSAGEPVSVVNDQWRTPTYAGDLARGIRMVIEQRANGLFHISGAEFMTPYDMAKATAQSLGLDEKLIKAVNAATFTQPARRPPRTGFHIDKARRVLGFEPLPFTEGLHLMLESDPG